MKLNNDVSKLISASDHPLDAGIQLLRNLILDADPEIAENIKWNSPNYTYQNEDRITMRIQPTRQVQLIFHCGAKKQAQSRERIIEDDHSILIWKENDRAIASFKTIDEIVEVRPLLLDIIKRWVQAAKITKSRT